MTDLHEKTELYAVMNRIVEQLQAIPRPDGSIHYHNWLKKKRKVWLSELEAVRPYANKHAEQFGKDYARLHFKVRRMNVSDFVNS